MAAQQQLATDSTAESATFKEMMRDSAAEVGTLKEVIAHQQLLLAQPTSASDLPTVDNAAVLQQLLSATLRDAGGHVKVLLCMP